MERLTDKNSQGDSQFNLDDTLAMIMHTNEMEKDVQAGITYLDLIRGTSLRRTEIVVGTWVIQTLCGATFMGFSTYFYQ